MPCIPCRIVRWVSDDPLPGVVEAVVRDIDGNIVRLVDKYPVFTEREIGPKSVFPIHVRLPVQVMTTDGRMSLVWLPYGLQRRGARDRDDPGADRRPRYLTPLRTRSLNGTGG